MSNIDQEFIEYIVKSLVGNPSGVSVARTIDEKGVLLELTVDPEDLGRVIGKRGATAQSLRTLLRALGTKNEARYNLKIIDTDGGVRTPYTPAQGSSAGAAFVADDVVNDDQTVTQSDAATQQPVVDPALAGPTVTVAEPSVEPQASPPVSDAVSKTRQELADLDDLDI